MLTVAYDGCSYAGFARQRNAPTIAGRLEQAVRQLDSSATEVRGASRTDAGVHARGQVAAFDTDRDIEPRGWVLGLAAHLPPTIAVTAAGVAPAGYEPSKEATLKQYRYDLLRSSVRDPFAVGKAWRIAEWIDASLVRAELDTIVGEHDFAAFRSSVDERIDTVRRIRRAELVETGPRRCTVVVEGEAFLHRMVRIIVGTAVDVGRGRRKPGAAARALESKQRDDLGMTAPPDGLRLEWIQLGTEPDRVWPPGRTPLD